MGNAQPRAGAETARPSGWPAGHSLRQLVDADALAKILEGFSTLTALPLRIVAHPEQSVLVSRGSAPLCEALHLRNPSSKALCEEADRQLADESQRRSELILGECPGGLVRVAVPVVVDDVLLASLVAGPVFLDAPPPGVLEERARGGGIELDEYLAAAAAVPVATEDQLRRAASVLGSVATLLVDGLLTAARAEDKAARLVAVEGALRAREALSTATAARLEAEKDVLARLAVSPAAAEGDLEAFARELTEAVAPILDVERVGVWLFDEDEGALRCIDLFSATAGAHERGAVIFEQEYREEFRELKTAKYVDAHDALTDRRTAGYVERYLKPNHITSMLDGVIRAGGKNLGTLCFEHVERPHVWETDEVALVCQLADQVALALANRDRRRAEEQRLLLEAKIQQAQKLESLGVLAGGIAHDFNNLLVGILGNADLALRDLGPESPARESLTDVVRAAERAAELVRQLLAYAGKGRFVVERVRVNAVIEQMLHLLKVSISKNVVLRLELAPDLPAIEADATQIRQVVLNLVINASEAIGERSGVISLATGVMDCDRAYLSGSFLDWDLPEGAYVYVETSDTGVGMDAQMIQRIFDPFFTTKFSGRGLGLAAALGIVRGHRGAIKVYSEPGHGTTIKALFPAAPRSPGDERVSQVVAAPRFEGTVLLVDDEEAVRAVGGRMLERLGFAVVTAEDGRAALSLFEADPRRFVAVILDLTMPRMDGDACFRELRRVDPAVRVLLSSGYNEGELVARFAGKGLAGFIQKPYRLTTLGEKLVSILGAR